MEKAITLNKNLSCEYICSIIQDMMNTHKDTEGKVLVLDIRSITDSPDSLLPKLCFKELKE